MLASNWANLIASNSSKVLATSILGNKASPFLTSVPGVVPSNPDNESQVVVVIFNWVFIFSLVLGKNADNNTDANLKLSAKLYKTVPNLSFFSSSLANIQGVVSSIYLLALPISANISSKASGILKLSIAFVTLTGVSKAKLINSLSISSLAVGAGITPPKYFSIIATVLDNKLPRSLQRSELIFFINISLLNNPSAPNGISLNK